MCDGEVGEEKVEELGGGRGGGGGGWDGGGVERIGRKM